MNFGRKWEDEMINTGGYVYCSQCHQSVPYPHFCPYNNPVPQQYYGYGSLYIDMETKELLKRIADALEKIAGKSDVE